jgi:hypothetical protein
MNIAIRSIQQNYTVIEENITDAVKQQGEQLPDTPEYFEKKNVIKHLHKTSVANCQEGILKLDFNGVGCPRYHRLSNVRGKALKALDDCVQKVVVDNIAKEIIEGLSLKQHLFCYSVMPTLGQHLFNIIKDRTEYIKTVMSEYQITEVYNIEHEQTFVMVFKDRERFNIERVLEAFLKLRLN